MGRGRAPRACPDQPLLQAAVGVAPFAQPLELVQPHQPVATEQPPAALAVHGGEEVDRAVQAVAFHQIGAVQKRFPKVQDLRGAALVGAIDKIAVSYMEIGIFL